jgi:FHS family L-fucose permease-like MFS transporter
MQTKPTTDRKFIVTLIFVTLFMLWGIAITMGDVLNRHFQNVLKFRAIGPCTIFIFGAYAIMGIPAGLFMKKFDTRMVFCSTFYTLLALFFLYLLQMPLHFYFSGFVICTGMWVGYSGNSCASLCGIAGRSAHQRPAH